MSAIAQVLGDLLDQIPEDEQIWFGLYGWAYDTKHWTVISDRHAHAVIPPEKMLNPGKILSLTH